MTGPEREVVAEGLELPTWAIPCQYTKHTGDTPASLAVWYASPRSCCGWLGPEFLYFCDPCWRYRSSVMGLVHCTNCDVTVGAFDQILRVERIT